MKKLVIVFVFLLLSFLPLQAFALNAPSLNVTASGLSVYLSWEAVPGATDYILVYAPKPYIGPDSIRTYDMGNTTSFSAKLWNNASFYVAIAAGNGNEMSPYSNIEDFLLTLDVDQGPVPAACAGEPPPEGPVSGNYRSYAYFSPESVSALDVSLRGWRTIAGTYGSGLYLFSRSKNEPIAHALTDAVINDVDLNRDGSVAAATDEDGRIYLFECDAGQPSWSYPTAADDEELYPKVEVVVSDDGRWLAAASDYNVYLFRRDRSAPVLKMKLSQDERLSTLDLSGDGSRLAVATEFGTAVNGNRTATLFLLDHTKVLWQTPVVSPDSNCYSNVAFLPLALSRDGTKLAAGGCDDQIRLWNTSSSKPLWTAKVGNDEEITGLAMAADGGSLAVTGETIHYVRDTSTRPDFSSSANWAFNYWLDYHQPSVYGALDSWPEHYWDGGSGRLPWGGLQGIAISDNGHYIYAGSDDESYLLHRDDNKVTRLFGNAGDAGGLEFHVVAMSPEASWVATGTLYGSKGQILRFEVAPVQKISTNLPLTVTFPDNPGGIGDFFANFGVDSYTVSYTVLKPGRAADVEQHWSLLGFDGTYFLSPFTDLMCSGDAEWTWTLNLKDGNVESTGSREINPPQCAASNVSSISAFDLFADLKPDLVGQGGVGNLSTDSVPLMKIQLGSGH